MSASNYDMKMVNSWLKDKLMSYSRIDRQPPRPIARLSALLTSFGIARVSHKFGFLFRYLYVNSLQFESAQNDSPASPPIEILFVAARKDFRTLEVTINGVIETCGQEVSRINIVVPDQDLSYCEAVVTSCAPNQIEMKVISETSLLDESLAKLIYSHFGARGGWVLQQVLKLEYARNSLSSGVLIIDADTVLIKNRTWLNSDGIQSLMPSWEFHRPYFEFLSTLTPFKSQLHFFPRFSFVSHHMLMQPNVVKEIFRACGWNGPRELVDSLCQPSNKIGQSPISIDYELYGHFLLLHYPEKVNLVKWANTSASYSSNISIDLLKERYSNFASVSLHTYLD
jgi:hypothetical protein